MIRLSDASRSRLSQETLALRQRFDGPRRVLQSLRRHPVAWLGGSLATGLAATFLFRRKPSSPKPRRGWRGMLGSLALTAIRPAVKAWLTVQLKQFLAAQLAAHAATRTGSNNPDRARLPGYF